MKDRITDMLPVYEVHLTQSTCRATIGHPDTGGPVFALECCVDDPFVDFLARNVGMPVNLTLDTGKPHGDDERE